MKTLKELSAELGVTSAAIYQRIKKKPLSAQIEPFIKKENGILYIAREGEELLRQYYDPLNIITIKQEENPISLIIDREKDALYVEINIKNRQIDNLNLHLNIKDRQIELLTQQMREMTTALIFAGENIKTAQNMAQNFQLNSFHNEFLNKTELKKKRLKKRFLFSRLFSN